VNQKETTKEVIDPKTDIHCEDDEQIWNKWQVW